MTKCWNFNSVISHKFRAKSVEYDGERFSSKLEFSFKQYLDLLIKSGEVIFYLTQIPVRMPGGTKLVVDFQVFYEDGSVRFIDTKGIETDSFKIKKREVEAIYPFKIEVVKKGDF